MKVEEFLNSHGYSADQQAEGYILTFDQMADILEKYRKEMHWPAPRKKVCSACNMIASGVKSRRAFIHTCGIK